MFGTEAVTEITLVPWVNVILCNRGVLDVCTRGGSRNIEGRGHIVCRVVWIDL